MQECAYSYVVKNDPDGLIQTEVKKQMQEQNPENNEFNWTVFAVQSSCAIENVLEDGNYNEKDAESRINCFAQLAEDEINGFSVVRNCSATHLENIEEWCSTDLAQETEFDLFWERIQGCFYDYVVTHDTGGDIQEAVKKSMEDDKKLFHIPITDQEGK